MASTPVAFDNVAAIEAMMAGLGNARCKFLGIGRQDNYNAKIHRPRDAHQNAQTRAVVGRVYQHRVFSVNKPNGRIIWIFERSSDMRLFLLRPRKGPLAYKVWQSDQTFSPDLWLYGQNWLEGEKAAEQRGPAELQQWLRVHRPADAGTSGDYVEYKAHIAQPPAPLPVPQSLAVPVDVESGLPVAPVSPASPASPVAPVPSDTQTTETAAEASIAEEAALPVTQHDSPSGEASTTTSNVVAQKAPKTRSRVPIVVPPSSRVLRQRGKKRNADEAELNDNEPAQQPQQPTPPVVAPTFSAPIVVAPAIEPQQPTIPRPAADPSSLLKVQPAAKKRKFSAADCSIDEDHCERESKRLLTAWSSTSMEIDSTRELIGVDVTPLTQDPSFRPAFNTSQQRTIIRYGSSVCEAFGGFENLGNRAIAHTVPVSKRRSG